jgi:hypothetical protein
MMCKVSNILNSLHELLAEEDEDGIEVNYV